MKSSINQITSQLVYCKTRTVRVPFISQISRPWRLRENNGSRIIFAAIY